MSVMKYARAVAVAGTVYFGGDAALDGMNHVGMTQAFASQCGGCTTGGGPFGGGGGPSGPSGGSERGGDAPIPGALTASFSCNCVGSGRWFSSPYAAALNAQGNSLCTAKNLEIMYLRKLPGQGTVPVFMTTEGASISPEIPNYGKRPNSRCNVDETYKNWKQQSKDFYKLSPR